MAASFNIQYTVVLAQLLLIASTLAKPGVRHNTGHGNSVGGSGGYPSNNHAQQSYPPRPYNFKYDVNDHYAGTQFGQREESDGRNVNGEYRVLLPDGRTQTVTYNADWNNGFNADVKYQGEAIHPPPRAGYNQPQGYGGGSTGHGGSTRAQSHGSKY